MNKKAIVNGLLLSLPMWLVIVWLVVAMTE
jgi:hypothetical protein